MVVITFEAMLMGLVMIRQSMMFLCMVMFLVVVLSKRLNGEKVRKEKERKRKTDRNKCLSRELHGAPLRVVCCSQDTISLWYRFSFCFE